MLEKWEPTLLAGQGVARRLVQPVCVALALSTATMSFGAEVVVFVDGARMDVASYETRNGMFVVTTLEGALQVLPLDYVDLEATRRVNETTAPQEHLSSPTSVWVGESAESPTSQPPEQGEPRRATGERGLARHAAELYGINHLYEAVRRELVNGFERGLSEQDRTDVSGSAEGRFLEDMARALREPFAAARMLDLTAASMDSELNESELQQWVAWLETTEVREINELERTALLDDNVESRQALRDASNVTPPTEARTNLIRRLDRAMPDQDDIEQALFDSLAGLERAMSEINSHERSSQGAEPTPANPASHTSDPESRLNTRLFTYRGLSDAALARYVAYWETTRGQRIHRAVSNAIANAFRDAGESASSRLIALSQEYVDQEMKQRLGERSEAMPTVRVFETANFRHTTPESEWAGFDVKKWNEAATMGILRAKPSVYFFVIAELGASNETGTEAVAEVSKANLESLAEKYRLLSEKPYELDGLDGVLIKTRVQLSGRDQLYRHWVFARNGYTYQLVASAAAADVTEEELDQHMKIALDGFEILDRSRLQAPASVGGFTEDFVSKRFGYRIGVASSPWGRWPTLSQQMSEADFGGLSGEIGAFVVAPVYLGPRSDDESDSKGPSLEALRNGLIALLGIDPDDRNLRLRTPVDTSERMGLDYDYRREVDGVSYDYRLQIWRGTEFGYLVASWNTYDSPAALRHDLVERFSFDPDHVWDGSEWSERELAAKAKIYNEIGTTYYNSERYTTAAHFLRQASEANKSDPVLVENLLETLTRASGFDEALSVAEQAHDRFPDELEIESYLPYLLSQMGRRDEALLAYDAVFDKGYRNEYDLNDFAELLWDMGHSQRALEEIRDYRKERDSVLAVRVAAKFLSRGGSFDEAVTVLKQSLRANPANKSLATDLLETYEKAERYLEAVDFADELIDKGHASSTILFTKGRAQFSLGRYAEAKSCFQASLDMDPTTSSARDYLEHTNGLLGQGSQESIRTPVAVVEVPDSLFTAEPAVAEAEAMDIGSRYLSRVSAISFATAQDYRRSEYVKVELTGQKGVNEFSSVEMNFNPLSERMYVNSLKVFDRTGALVRNGAPENFYVRDDTSDDTATHKRILHIPIPGLEVGHIIELIVTTQRLAPPTKLPFLRRSFAANEPVAESAVVFRGDHEAVAARFVGGVVESHSDGARVWTVRGLPAYRAESASEDSEQYLPYLWLADAHGDWASLGREYITDIEHRLKPSEQIHALASEITQGSGSDEERFDRIADYVQKALTYKAIEFGRRAWIPNAATDILANRYGDCKDHSLLFYQLAQAAGLDVRLALINTASPIRTDLPSLDQFDHMVVHSPTHLAGHFFDLTDKDHDVSRLPPVGLASRNALLLDKERPQLVQVSAYPEDSSVVESDRRVRVQGSDLVIEETLTMNGYYAAFYRGALKARDAASQRELLEAQMGGGEDVVLVDYDLDNLTSSRKPLVLTLHYRLESKIQDAAGRRIGKLPAVWERALLELDRVQGRRTPFRLRYPITFHSRVAVASPDGYRIAEAGGKEQADEALVTWAVDVEKSDSSLVLTYHNRRLAGSGGAAEYGPFFEAVDQSLEAVEVGLVLAPK